MIRTPLFSRSLSLLLVCLAALALSGCLGMEDTQTKPRKVAAPVKTMPPLEEARTALMRGDHARAEVLAQRLVDDPTTPQRDMSEALGVYARAASANHHPNAALTALDQWQGVAPGADATLGWQTLWSESIAQLSEKEGQTRAEGILADANRSLAAHNLALSYSVVRGWEKGDASGFDLLERAYGASTPKEKGLFEHALARTLRGASPAALSLVVPLVTPENQKSFPNNIILIAQAQREALSPNTRAAAEATLASFVKQFPLADATVITDFLPKQQVVSKGAGTGKPVVLALPLSGQYGAVAAKIMAGAEVAAGEMGASLTVIDTDQPDWTAKIASLPADVRLVGGPLRSADYATAKAKGLLASKAFFTFLPSLEGSDEGRVAWRFITAPQDQTRTLVELGTRLGIKGYAIIYPQETYGQRMASLFEQTVQAAGGTVAGRAAYDPSSPSSWMSSLGSLLAKPASLLPADTAPYRAVFLPDTWKSMEVLVPAMMSYGETRQLLLGSSLWEQELTARPPADVKNFGLAVFPSAWKAQGGSQEASRLQAGISRMGKGNAEFWHGLGYDFARFAARFEAPAATDAAAINSQLQSIRGSWAMAPLYWDASGKASQALFLFTPIAGGFAPLDEPTFSTTFQNAWAL